MGLKINTIKITDNTNFEDILEVGKTYKVEDGKIYVDLVPISISRIEKYTITSYLSD